MLDPSSFWINVSIAKSFLTQHFFSLWLGSPGRIFAGQQRGYFSVCVVSLVVGLHMLRSRIKTFCILTEKGEYYFLSVQIWAIMHFIEFEYKVLLGLIWNLSINVKFHLNCLKALQLKLGVVYSISTENYEKLLTRSHEICPKSKQS